MTVGQREWEMGIPGHSGKWDETIQYQVNLLGQRGSYWVCNTG